MTSPVFPYLATRKHNPASLHQMVNKTGSLYILTIVHHHHTKRTKHEMPPAKADASAKAKTLTTKDSAIAPTTRAFPPTTYYIETKSRTPMAQDSPTVPTATPLPVLTPPLARPSSSSPCSSSPPAPDISLRVGATELLLLLPLATGDGAFPAPSSPELENVSVVVKVADVVENTVASSVVHVTDLNRVAHPDMRKKGRVGGSFTNKRIHSGRSMSARHSSQETGMLP